LPYISVSGKWEVGKTKLSQRNGKKNIHRKSRTMDHHGYLRCKVAFTGVVCVVTWKFIGTEIIYNKSIDRPS
jgi:hypothetical protein